MKIPAPGRIVDGLHVWAEGQGSPTVVLEAGIAASSVSWSLVQPRIAEFTRVMSYDRAGFGWSAEARTAATANEAAGALAAMLEQSGETPPYVLVGHSFGGLIVRMLQQKSPALVAGLVLVDPVVRSDWRDANGARLRTLQRGVLLSRRGAMLARIGVVRVCLRLLTGGAQRIPRLMARVSAGDGAGVASRLATEVGKIPREFWPAIAEHWSEARSFEAMADNLESLPESAAQLNEQATLGDLPVVILSAGKRIPEHEHDAALSSRGRNIITPNSGHWMQLDTPDSVVEAIRAVLDQVRAQ
jgi:pimeloyl-ACP methyl ester carboxylesterase